MFNGTELIFLTCLCTWAVQNAPVWVAAFAVGTSVAQTIDLLYGFYRSRKKAAMIRGMMSGVEKVEKVSAQEMEEELTAMLKRMKEDGKHK